MILLVLPSSVAEFLVVVQPVWHIVGPSRDTT